MGARRTAMQIGMAACALALSSCDAGGTTGEPDLPFVGKVDLRSLLGNVTQDQVVADEDVTVAAHSWRGPGFVLPSPRAVHLVADGKGHTEKGFRLYVMTTDELSKFEKKQAFKDVPAFEGLKVHSIDKTDTLPAGSWCVVVHNSENALRTMVVHLRVVVGGAT